MKAQLTLNLILCVHVKKQQHASPYCAPKALPPFDMGCNVHEMLGLHFTAINTIGSFLCPS